METIVDTALQHGVVYYPIQPPRASMLVVVKATYALEAAEVAALADAQDPATGELYHDEDPTRSVRYPTDFALIKPRGECFVTGSARPLTGRAEERTVASFSVGAISKSISVYGDRKWTRTGISAPVPFTEMPLSWERAFGGAGFDPNPLGRGIHPDAQGDVWLPNLETAERAITAREHRPDPAGAFPIGMSWKKRQRFVGTYGDAWRRTRFPWLAEDFRFAFFNEAPDDQQIEGYWTGDEAITARHLHPRLPSVRTRLPGLRARAFVEHETGSSRAGAFEEIGLVLDTITLDADRGVASCVWRGALELDHDALRPDGIARLFVMDEPRAARSSREACLKRMLDKIAADAQAVEDLGAVEPPADAGPDDGPTIEGQPPPGLAALIAEAQAREAIPPGRDPDALFAKVKADLAAAGLDTDALSEQAAASFPIGPLVPPSPEKLRAAFAQMGQELPPELEELLEQLADAIENPPEPAPEPTAEPEVDLRALVVSLHRERRALVGDFTGANLSELDLPGLDATGAILTGADLRGANLRKARLGHANLARAELLMADLSGATLAGADLTGALLEAANLSGANLDGATLEAVEATDVVLDGATLRKADLRNAMLDGASLVKAICDEADFSRARMNRANGADGSFVEARFWSVTARQLKMDRAVLTNLRVGRGADLSGSSFKGARGDGSRWRDSRLEAVNFSGATLNGADFTNAILTTAQLGGCPLKGAVFLGATLIGAGLSRANLFEGSFREANLNGADLSGANLYSADFFQARAEGVDLSGANLDGTVWERP